MLSRHDAALAERDPMLPALATVLDPVAFSTLIGQLVEGATPASACITYLRYKPGASCLVGYQLDMDGASLDVYAIARPRDAHDKFAKARKRVSVPGALGRGRIVIEDQGLIVGTFPNDDVLRALPRLMGAATRGELLGTLLPERPDLWNGAIELLRYKPERRYVACLHGESGTRAVLKMYSNSDFARAELNAAQLMSGRILRLPRRLGCSHKRQMLAFGWADGRLLSELLAAKQPDEDALRGVGRALGELHEQEPGRLAMRSQETHARSLFRAAQGVANVCPELRIRAHQAARELGRRLVASPMQPRAVHGDFHPGQVLVDPAGIAILDLDEAALSDPVADIGSFAAQLERDVLLGRMTASHASSALETLQEGYASVARRPSPEHLVLHAAAALLRLAPEPFRQREPDWPLLSAVIIERVEAWLQQANTQAPRSRTTETKSQRPLDSALAVLEPGGQQSAMSCQSTGDSQESGAAALELVHRTIGHSARDIPVEDQCGAMTDSAMPLLARALDPMEMSCRLRALATNGPYADLQLRAIRAVRHRPGRRCLIEYDVESTSGPLTLVGKLRARGLDSRTYRLCRSLWDSGFSVNSARGIDVPEPVGAVPDLSMWLQRKVAGTATTRSLCEPNAAALARRIVDAAHELHRAGPASSRQHTIADELRILRERLTEVALIEPRWAHRLRLLLSNCERIAARIPTPSTCGIHRDFYADHVLVDAARLHLLDFDLYCNGDPALDIGNFLAHLTEQGLREHGDPEAFADQQAAMAEHYYSLAGKHAAIAVEAYSALTLARHVHISMRIDTRRRCVEPLLQLCEERLTKRQGAS